MRTTACWIIGLGLTLAVGATASASIIAEHAGDANPLDGSPTTWTRHKSGNNVNVQLEAGPPSSILIDDFGTDTSFFYTYSPTAAEHADAMTNGWKITANIRVNNVNDVIGDFGIAVQYNASNGDSYTLEWGSNEDGEPIVGIQLGARPDWVHTVTGSNTGEFNLYELVYDPDVGSASLYINGVNVRNDIGARTVNAPRVLFGAGSSTGTGSGSYNLVRFESIPEPASLALMSVGGLWVLGRRRHVAA